MARILTAGYKLCYHGAIEKKTCDLVATVMTNQTCGRTCYWYGRDVQMLTVNTA